jgi:hypothetical protein
LYKVPHQLVQEREEAEDSPTRKCYSSFGKENEMSTVSTVHNAIMQDKINRYVENENICITECNRYMIDVTEQPVISCITPFSEKY